MNIAIEDVTTDDAPLVLFAVRWRWTAGENAGRWYDYGTFEDRAAAEAAARHLAADELKHWNEAHFEALIFEYDRSTRVRRAFAVDAR